MTLTTRTLSGLAIFLVLATAASAQQGPPRGGGGGFAPGGPGGPGGRPAPRGDGGFERGPGSPEGMRGPGGPGGPGGMRGPGGPGGPGGGPGRGEDAPPPPPPPDWEPSAEMASAISASEPEFAAFLERVKAADPERHRLEMWHVAQQARQAAAARERGDTERATRLETSAKLERKVHGIVGSLDGKAPSTAQSAALQDALGQLFDLREDMRRDEITQLEKRIADLKSSLADRRARKAEIVQRRMKDLLDQDDPLGW